MMKRYIWFGLLVLSGYLCHAQSIENDSYYVKPNNTGSYIVEEAISGSNWYGSPVLSRSNGQSVTDWYLLPYGKKGLKIPAPNWLYSSNHYWINSLDATTTKSILYIIDPLMIQGNEAQEIIGSIGATNVLAKKHYHPWNYVAKHTVKNTVTYDLQKLYSEYLLGACGSTPDSLNDIISSWDIDDYDIVIFIAPNLLQSNITASAIWCTSPQIIIGGHSLVSNQFILQHELYHCASDKFKDLYNHYCSNDEYNIMYHSDALCNLYLDVNQVIHLIDNNYVFDPLDLPNDRFPKVPFCCVPFPDYPDQKNLDTDPVDHNRREHALQPTVENRQRNGIDKELFDLLRRADIGDYKINDGLDNKLKKSLQNWTQIREKYRAHAKAKIYKTLPDKRLNQIFDFKTNKERSDYREQRIKGHMDLIDDNMLAILKTRIATMKPSLVKDKIMNSQSIEKVGQVYLNL